MRESVFLHKTLEKSCPYIHKGQTNAIVKACGGILNGGKLSITSLGRSQPGTAKVKNKIKQVDRVLGNGQIYQNIQQYYQAMAQYLLVPSTYIEILVDWSSCANHKNHMLKASIVKDSRSMTLYEEVHPEEKLANPKVHQQFLERLKQIIPSDCEVNIITDAGFGITWFKLVTSLGWHFTGRVRNNKTYSQDDGETWHRISVLYPKATHRVQNFGEIILTKSEQLVCNLFLYREKVIVKQKYKRKVKSGRTENVQRKSHKEPWLLACSLPERLRKGKYIVKAYKKRMKIEHEFRDMKDSKWGIGLSETKTRDTQRLAILLLIGALTIFLLYLIGLIAEQNKWQHDYQANTVKSHRVLSLIFLGLQLIKHESEKINLNHLYNKMKELPHLFSERKIDGVVKICGDL